MKTWKEFNKINENSGYITIDGKKLYAGDKLTVKLDKYAKLTPGLAYEINSIDDNKLYIYDDEMDEMEFDIEEAKKVFSLTDINNNKTESKLNDNEFYAIEEDGGDQLHFVGIYDDLNTFIDYKKEEISSEKNINKSDIQVESLEGEITFKYNFEYDNKRSTITNRVFVFYKVEVNKSVK
jgi:hypothetical protein